MCFECAARGVACGAGDGIAAGRGLGAQPIAELRERGEVAARAVVAFAGEREQRRRRHLHRDVTRRLDEDRAVDRQECELGRAEHDLVAGFEPVHRRRRAVDERARLAAVVDPHERAVAKLDRAVLARHRRIGQLDEVAFAAADAAAAQRQLELAARIGAFDHDEARQRHARIVRSRW